MHFRNQKNPKCMYCLHAETDKETKKICCTLSDTEMQPEDSCRKFTYDIFAYQPKLKQDFGKFKKEDFEL